ncbi:MAG: hypothetical protein ACRDRX_08705 [Pseudonocardiaceae bacterium]
MSDYVFGDSVGRDKIEQKGHRNRFTINNSEGVSRDELDAAITELRDFVKHLRRTGVVAPDGSVTDPGAVVQAVHSEPSRLKALTRVITSGAKDAVLSVAKDGVSALIVGLVGAWS